MEIRECRSIIGRMKCIESGVLTRKQTGSKLELYVEIAHGVNFTHHRQSISMAWSNFLFRDQGPLNLAVAFDMLL